MNAKSQLVCRLTCRFISHLSNALSRSASDVGSDLISPARDSARVALAYNTIKLHSEAALCSTSFEMAPEQSCTQLRKRAGSQQHSQTLLLIFNKTASESSRHRRVPSVFPACSQCVPSVFLWLASVGSSAASFQCSQGISTQQMVFCVSSIVYECKHIADGFQIAF